MRIDIATSYNKEEKRSEYLAKIVYQDSVYSTHMYLPDCSTMDMKPSDYFRSLHMAALEFERLHEGVDK